MAVPAGPVAEMGAAVEDTEVTEVPPDTAVRLEYEGASSSPCSDNERSMVQNMWKLSSGARQHY